MLSNAKILFEFQDKSSIIKINKIKFKYNGVYIYDDDNYQYQYEAYKMDHCELPENKYKYTIISKLETNPQCGFLMKRLNKTNSINITLLEIKHYCDKCNRTLPDMGGLRPYNCVMCYNKICSQCDLNIQRCMVCDNMVCDNHELYIKQCGGGSGSGSECRCGDENENEDRDDIYCCGNCVSE